MKRLRFAAMVIAMLATIATATVASVARAAAPRDLFAHGSEQQIWSAEVVTSVEGQARVEKTLVRYRLAGEGAQWREPIPLAGRAVALATRGSELLVLMDGGGDWQFVSESGVRGGNPLPLGLDMLVLAGDGEDIWAVADGSADPSRASTAPSMSASATHPAAAAAAAAPSTTTTHPLLVPPAPHAVISTQRSAPPSTAAGPTTRPQPLGLYLLTRGRWGEHALLPDAIRRDDVQELSLLASDRRLLLAVLDRVVEHDIRIFTFADGKWSAPAMVPRGPDVTHIQLLDFHGQPILWAAGDFGPGAMILRQSGAGGSGARGGSDAGKWTNPIALESSPTLTSFPRRALAVALGQIRLVYADGKGRLAEQRYDLSGKRLGDPIVGAAPTGAADVMWLQAVYIVLTVLLLFVMLGTLRKRQTLQEALRRRDELNLAPIPARFAAGVIDASPLIVALLILGRGNATADVVRQRLTSWSPEAIWLIGALAVYLLHTTIFELIRRATIGKMLFGMRVMDLSGERAPARAILIRNAMRVFDIFLFFFPLTLIVFSPLRQRVGDVVAGTLVARTAPAEDEEDDESGEGS